MCTTQERFTEVTDATDSRMDELIILCSFVIPGGGSNDGTTFDVVVSSRRLFGNVAKSERARSAV